MKIKVKIAVILLFFMVGVGWAESQNTANAQSSLQVQRIEIDRDTKNPGRFTMNAYVVYAPTTRQALLIDPGLEDPRIDTFLHTQNLSLVGILNTHGHGDHTGGNWHYAQTFNTKVYAHEKERFFYHNPREIELPDQVYFNGEKNLVLGNFIIQVIEIPGHSKGSVCFLIDQKLFSGDNLFAKAIGKPAGTDAKSKKESLLLEIATIKAKLFTLPPETPVYPGHALPTTIGNEKTNNQWFQEKNNSPAGPGFTANFV